MYGSSGATDTCAPPVPRFRPYTRGHKRWVDSMSNQCHVCIHPRREAIDLMIGTGRPIRRIAADFGVVYGSLLRHHRNGHVQSSKPSLPSPTPRGSDPLANLRADLELVNAMDPTQMSPSAAMGLFAERRRLNEAVARLDPPMVTPPEVPSVAKFIELLEDVVSRHPEERERFMTAWKAYKKETT